MTDAVLPFDFYSPGFDDNPLAFDLGLGLGLNPPSFTSSEGSGSRQSPHSPDYDLPSAVLHEMESMESLQNIYSNFTNLGGAFGTPVGSIFSMGPATLYPGPCVPMHQGTVNTALLQPTAPPPLASVPMNVNESNVSHYGGSVKDEQITPSPPRNGSSSRTARASSEDSFPAYAGSGTYPRRIPTQSLQGGGSVVPPRRIQASERKPRATLSNSPTNSSETRTSATVVTPSTPKFEDNDIDPELREPSARPTTPTPMRRQRANYEPVTPRRQIRHTSDEFAFETVPPQTQRTDVEGEDAPPPWTGIKRWENFTEFDADYLMTGVAPSGGRSTSVKKKRAPAGYDSDSEYEPSTPLARNSGRIPSTPKTPKTARKAKSMGTITPRKTTTPRKPKTPK